MDITDENHVPSRTVIRDYLSKMTDIDDRVRQALSGNMSKEVVENQLLTDLDQSGYIDEMVDALTNSKRRKPNHAPNVSATVPAPLPPGRANRSLLIQVIKGKAFTAHLLDQPTFPGMLNANYTLHVSFRNQRYSTMPAPCCDEPDIRDSFELSLVRSPGDGLLSSTDLLSIADKVHLVLVKTDPNSETHLISSRYYDWRSLLSSPSGRETVSIELMGIGSESNIPVGILDVSLSVVAPPDPLEEDVVTEQAHLERQRQAERDRLFLLYTKQWWREYLQVRESHGSRLVKLYAQDENLVNRPVCSYVQPLRPGRCLEHPRHAARFVSLIRHDRAPAVGNASKAEMWSSTHAFLVANKGDVENHATLLCSLLLGFGLDAYVCLGTKNKGSTHAWVVTLASDTNGRDVTFWEPLTSNRYIHRCTPVDEMLTKPPPTPKHPYRTIGCVFNHQRFYANLQPSDQVEFTDFQLDNEKLWKSLAGDAISSICGSSVMWMPIPCLMPSSRDSVAESNCVEMDLRRLITEYRETEGLMTVFDDTCCYTLGMALSAYEIERKTGLAYGNEEFSQAITNYIPEGYTFKAYPIAFTYVNAKRIFAAAIKSKSCSQLLSCRGDEVKMGVRVHIESYPEKAVATWIMFACKYKNIL